MQIRISIGTIVLIAFVFFATLFLSVYHIILSTQSHREVRLIEQQRDMSQESLDSILTNVEELALIYQIFEQFLGITLDELSISVPEASDGGGSGDLAAITGMQELSPDGVTEIFDIRMLRDSLSRNINPVNEMGRMLRSEQNLLSDLPTLWPVIGGRGLVSMDYGPNIHPVRNNWFIHQGVDIPGPLGAPVVASANGTVVSVKIDSLQGLGNTIQIQHKYGFRTQYSHLGTVLVAEGAEVYQGQKIATLGNTGAATQPLVNFRIVLGTEILDPVQFIKVRTDFNRWISQSQ